jgi:hypothetical protein
VNFSATFLLNHLYLAQADPAFLVNIRPRQGEDEVTLKKVTCGQAFIGRLLHCCFKSIFSRYC